MVGKFNTQSLLMEVFGTFALLYFGGLVSLYGPGDLTSIAIAHALILFLIIYIGGDISGGYFNPAVIIAFLVSKDNNIKVSLSYLAAELVGALLAGVLLLAKGLPNKEGLGYPMPNPDSDLFTCFVYETLTTFLLVLSIFYNVKCGKPLPLAAAISSIVVLMSILCVGKISGGSLNPLRSLGPSIIDGNVFFYGFWVYLTAPLLGGALGALYYEFILRDNLDKIKTAKELEDENMCNSYNAFDEINQLSNQKTKEIVDN